MESIIKHDKAILRTLRPMKAQDVNPAAVKCPTYGQVKYDGIRALVIGGIVYSRTLKRIRSAQVQSMFGRPEFEGFDGELIVGEPTDADCYRKTNSHVMSFNKPATDMRYYVFDTCNNKYTQYLERIAMLTHRIEEWKKSESSEVLANSVHRAETVHLNDEDALHNFLNYIQNKGYEGAIFRDPYGLYKYGRSTLREGYLLKYKFWQDGEFEIVGCIEAMQNGNDPEADNFGLQVRSKVSSNLIPKSELGAFVCKYGDLTFNVGTGFSASERKVFWIHRQSMIGRTAKVKYMSIGEKDRPRSPVFLGFRHKDDM